MREVVAMGSSPLARGLLVQPRREGLGLGIIPARAGFTARCTVVHETTPDHPRSRGVYPDGTPRSGSWDGSSPLARGLHDGRPAQGAQGRIIPARAGFTNSASAPRGRESDHPRSRGVYRTTCPAPLVAAGSSPLARGLRGYWAGSRRVCWIIPARAGFTGRRRARGGAPPDHPRSRGVYLTKVMRLLISKGSSPLARGLPIVVNDDVQRQGIIPARAGFTLRRRSGRRTGRDHPRSRGVYRLGLAHHHGRHGSSPLARGLRRALRAHSRDLGIIPARAGFTRHHGRRRRVRPDHPRSRGVYWACPLSGES